MEPEQNNDEPPNRGVETSALNSWYQDNFSTIEKELGPATDPDFQERVRAQFKSLPKDERSAYKKRAKKAKDEYFAKLEIYLVTHPHHEVDEKDSSGLQKRRLKRQAEEAELDQSAIVPPKKRKRKRRKREINEIIDDTHDNSDPAYELPKKLTKQQRKAQAALQRDQRIEMVIELQMDKMKKAAAADWKANKEGKPATSKLKLLLDREIISTLENTHYHTLLIEKYKVLDIIRDWLMPFPDGCLPLLRIREDMYRILQKLRLELFDQESIKEYLLMSDERTAKLRKSDKTKAHFLPLGKLLKFLCGHPHETPKNRTLLRDLIIGWVKPLLNFEKSPLPRSSDKQRINERNKVIKSERRYMDSLERKRARFPRIPWHDFNVNAKRNQEDITKLEKRVDVNAEKKLFFNRVFKKLNSTLGLKRDKETNDQGHC